MRTARLPCAMKRCPRPFAKWKMLWAPEWPTDRGTSRGLAQLRNIEQTLLAFENTLLPPPVNRTSTSSPSPELRRPPARSTTSPPSRPTEMSHIAYLPSNPLLGHLRSPRPSVARRQERAPPWLAVRSRSSCLLRATNRPLLAIPITVHHAVKRTFRPPDRNLPRRRMFRLRRQQTSIRLVSVRPGVPAQRPASRSMSHCSKVHRELGRGSDATQLARVSAEPSPPAVADIPSPSSESTKMRPLTLAFSPAPGRGASVSRHRQRRPPRARCPARQDLTVANTLTHPHRQSIEPLFRQGFD
jgi:hypothetical protein